MNIETESLYQYIAASMTDGQLPNEFSLPQHSNENELKWMDGALDGVSIFHMGYSDIKEETKALMEKAINAASETDTDKADELFFQLGQKARAIAVIDELQSYIIKNKEILSANGLYHYAVHVILDSADKESVKFGLSLLELFHIDDNEKLKAVVRILGLSDEFSIFAIFVMLQWNEGNKEIFELAKKIHGWGRIHAIERLEPTTEEIKQWLLREGVHNEIMAAYSALVCWQKIDGEEILQGSLSREDFSGIRDIIEGLLNEGPIPGISQIENAPEMILIFLDKAKNMELTLKDYEVVRAIRVYYENEKKKNSSIVDLCQEILQTDTCRNFVKEAVNNGTYLELADDLKIDYKDGLLLILKTEFQERYFLANYLIDDARYRPEVFTIFNQNLSLDDMKTLPTNTLGLGPDYKAQQQLECIVQKLKQYPLEGIEFVRTALQSAPVRTRNLGLHVLQDWVNMRGISLHELLPDMHTILCHLRDIEVDDKAQNLMDNLIRGDFE